MDAPDRQTSGYLTFLRRAAEAPRSFSLFALVRGAAARALDKPPVGASRLPSQDLIGLRQIPHVRFPAPTLESVNFEAGKGIVEGYWLGLTGPMSPLPLHLTEFAMIERRDAKAQPFGDFLHLLAERFLQLFYRAWATSQPAVEADRPETDNFANYVGRLSGANEGAGPDAAFPANARLHYAALFASRRSAGAIEGGLSHLLGMAVEISRVPAALARYRSRGSNAVGSAPSPLGRCDHRRAGTARLGQFRSAHHCARYRRISPSAAVRAPVPGSRRSARRAHAFASRMGYNAVPRTARSAARAPRRDCAARLVSMDRHGGQ